MKRTVFLLIAVINICNLFSQNFQVEVPRYSWINYQLNRIQVPGDNPERLNTFFKRLDSLIYLKTGRLNIMHIGGSHVQADVFSNQVRRNLDRINGDLKPSRGYIFPFSVAKTNNPTNYSVKYKGEWKSARNVQKDREIPLGVGGIAVYTDDPKAEITIKLNTDEFDKRWDFDKLELIGYTEGYDQLMRPILKYNDSIMVEAEYDPDSITYIFLLPN